MNAFQTLRHMIKLAKDLDSAKEQIHEAINKMCYDINSQERNFTIIGSVFYPEKTMIVFTIELHGGNTDIHPIIWKGEVSIYVKASDRFYTNLLPSNDSVDIEQLFMASTALREMCEEYIKIPDEKK